MSEEQQHGLAPSNSTEEWRDIVGYEGLYMVSNHGRIKSIGRGIGRSRVSKVLLGSTDESGRKSISLHKSPHPHRRFKVHRLVLTTFVGPCPDGMEGCHNDGNPSNNRLDNLRWDTHIENEKDKTAHGTHHFGELKGGAILTTEDVMRMRDIRRVGASHQKIADWFSVPMITAYQAVTGVNWSHLPYVTRGHDERRA